MAMNAEAMNEIFRNSVNQAQECAKKTKDEGQKGIIYATLALAMANTGVISVELSEAAEMTPKAEAAREDIKPKAAKKSTEQKDPKPASKKKGSEDELNPNEAADESPAVVNATKSEAAKDSKEAKEGTEEKTFGAEWTDEAVEYFAKETEFIQEHQGKLYDAFYEQRKEQDMSDDDADKQAQADTIEYFNDEIERATAHTCHTQEDINPMNIKYIICFLEAIERGEEPKEGAYLPF